MARITAILFIGDVVGRAGRPVVRELLPGLRHEYGVSFVVANGENAAGGLGITPQGGRRAARRRRRRDHARQPHLPPPRGLAVPGGTSAGSCARTTSCATQPGRGHDDRRARRRLAGRREPERASCTCRRARRRSWPIDEALREVVRCRPRCWSTCTPRSTSEKVALGWYLDGKVTAVVGTHTHVPTADAARPAGRHRLHHRRRHDRRPRRRDRHEEGAVDRGHAHPHADALRALRGGPVDQSPRRSARPRRAAADVDRSRRR